MNAQKILLLLGIPACLLLSCSTTEQATSDKKTTFSVQAGSNIGGITENTDMSVVPGVHVPPEATVDAFSGATQPGFNAGVHLNRKLNNNQLETGVDYMFNHQTFNYIDAGNHYIGVRELHVSQLMLPATYNLVLFKRRMPEAELQIKAGFIGQVNFVKATGTGILPDYSVHPFSAGPTLGISAYPLSFRNGNKLGFYFDIYRGSQIYEGFYNQKEFEMPGSSFARFGLKFHFR